MIDRTAEAVRRQLLAMGCSRYEVGIRDREGRMMNREWTPAEVEKALPWLKRQNAQGADIYVRPAQEERHGLILVDDVDRVTIETMREVGLAPAAVIETSPKNCQAWVKVGAEVLPEIRTEVARNLARSYGADPNSADHRHYGRLAGFTNRKPEHMQEGRGYPYVLCHEAGGQAAEKGTDLVQAAHDQVQARAVEDERQRRIQAIHGSQEKASGDPVAFFRKEVSRLRERYGQNIDWSRADFMAAVSMAEKGYDPGQIGDAIAAASPDLAGRKAGHVLDYIRRTVTAVFKDPRVLERRQQIEQGQQLGQNLKY